MSDTHTEKIAGLFSPEQGKELPPNVVMLEKPEAVYRIIYGYHDQPQKAGDLGTPQALVLETATRDYSEKHLAENLLSYFTGHIQYKNIIRVCQEQAIPIYFTDTTDYGAHQLLAYGLAHLEAITGAALVLNLAKDFKKKTGRREFLGMMGKGLAATYLFGPFMMFWVNGNLAISQEQSVRLVGRFLEDLVENTHPETDQIIITLRNYLMAQKLKAVAQDITTPNTPQSKPEVAIVLGASHTGIENALQKEDQARTELVHRLLQVPGLGESGKKIATITRLDFDKSKNSWVATKIFKDPSLAPLEAKF